MTELGQGKDQSIVVLVLKTVSPIDDLIPPGFRPLTLGNGTSGNGVGGSVD